MDGAQVAEFFEPSIQAIVNSIKDKFTQRIATNSVRTFGVFETNPQIANPPTVRVPRRWLCYKPVAVRATRETFGGPWVEVLQAGHAYVRTSRYARAASNLRFSQQQSSCGWSSFISLGPFRNGKDRKSHIRGKMQLSLPAVQSRTRQT